MATAHAREHRQRATASALAVVSSEGTRDGTHARPAFRDRAWGNPRLLSRTPASCVGDSTICANGGAYA
jgi:hypothetical protein